jgi:hypothetical protein
MPIGTFDYYQETIITLGTGSKIVINQAGMKFQIKILFFFFLYLISKKKRQFMKLTVPSTSVKSRFLKTLPIDEIFRDLRNNHLYQVKEKRNGTCYSRFAVPYFGSEEQQTELSVPEKHMKAENLVRTNIMSVMKQRLCFAESLNSQLMSKMGLKDGLEQIKETLGCEDYYETADDAYLIEHGVIFHMRKKDCKSGEESKPSLREFSSKAWADSSMLSKVIDKQQRIQSKLLSHLSKVI